MKKILFHLSIFLLVAAANAQNPPVANFSCDTVSTNPCCFVFNDLSTNSPASWSWSSPGGAPSASSMQNPVICYPSNGIYTVILIATNSFGSDTAMATITVSPSICSCTGSVGMEENNSSSQINIYPNPVTNELRIENGELKIKEVEIYDVLGKVQLNPLSHERGGKGGELIINVSSLHSGVYFVKVTNINGAKAAARFVKI